MKHYRIFLFLFVFFSSSLASVPRKPLMEEMTSTTCRYCDESDSVIRAFEAEHSEEMTVLKWFTDWKSRPGVDPFYHAFPAGLNRTVFYGITGVPNLGMNGSNFIITGSGTTLDILNKIEKDYFNKTSPYTITIQQAIIGDSLECSVTVTLVDNITVDTSLRIGIVIAERIIYFKEESQTEYTSTVHTNVVRGTLPDFTPHGAPALLMPLLAKNESKTFTYRKLIDKAWNREMLRTTAFIQSVHTGEVMQSESSLINSAAVSLDHSFTSASAFYPNPASGFATISFVITEEKHVSAALYDINGKFITNIFDNRMNAGRQFISFDASHFPSGLYYCRLQIGEQMETKSVIMAH